MGTMPAGRCHSGVADSECCGRCGGTSQPHSLPRCQLGEEHGTAGALAPVLTPQRRLQGLVVLRASSPFGYSAATQPLTPLHIPSLPASPRAPGRHPAGDTAQDDAKEQLGLKECPHWARASGASPKHQPELAQLWDCGGPLDPSLSHSRGAQGRRQCPGLLFPWDPGQQGRAGCPSAQQLRWHCRHWQLECWGGWPQLTPASCFPQQQGQGLPHPPPPGHPNPRGDSAWGQCLGTELGDSAWGQSSRPLTPKKGILDLALGTGTRDVPASLASADTGSSPLWHTGIYWRRMCLMSRGISKD
ncbi:uncharacterized protein LOC118692074 [Molothrus ater]|uniref:uncharacterized protein LOC118692074 n=1 Tax=Molothrus ater TaxID=84834 RepID=UPI00174BA070|nr:uncharacterized protein LOC118692074 [Molothrus ater]